ncbi:MULTISPECIES: DNA/RNA nuclease SfsA [unclassified Roseitalea]|uniref:DNA/RNA nuclease SfsA n=1 Tax=unclassified Roseitalea TaxID=2639107 RepID=UPI00273FDE01|nr:MULTISPECIES: DNA/RNA nuclease SfsA [unclassified Roseitalea]
MIFDPPLIEARLIRRYKRFLADVTLADGGEATVSVPNTGSMMGLTAPGARVLLSRSCDPKRKYPHRLEIVEADGTLVGINTGLPNRLVEEAIDAGMIGDLGEYASLARERKYGANSRIDILLEDPARGRAYVEVKNVHLRRRAGLAEFPDTKTARGAKHLRELAAMAQGGHRAIMVYLIQRADCESLRLCRDLDPDYAAQFDRAVGLGLEAFAVRCQISRSAIVPEAVIPIDEPIMTAAQ